MYKVWRDLIKPKNLVAETSSLTNTYVRFFAEPLERGFGQTLGNSLRRVLLSTLPGAAIVQARFEGVSHEFSTIPGVKEDMTDIVLNLKKVRLKLHSDTEETLTINKSGEGVVTAGDIQCPPSVEIIDHDVQIATLGKDASLICEMLVKTGRGYVPSEDQQSPDQKNIIGTILLDALFSPVTRVNFQVTNTRVGRRTDFDRLVMEVWTNGAISPEDAIGISAKVLKEQLNIFINFEEEPEIEEEEEEEVDETPEYNEHLNRRVDEMDLSVRAANCLRNANIRHIGEFVQKSESDMLKTKNFGRKSLNEIKDILAEMGLSLSMKLPNWTPPKDDGGEEEEAPE